MVLVIESLDGGRLEIGSWENHGEYCTGYVIAAIDTKFDYGITVKFDGTERKQIEIEEGEEIEDVE